MVSIYLPTTYIHNTDGKLPGQLLKLTGKWSLVTTLSILMYLEIFLNLENFSQEFLCFFSGGQVLLDNVMVLCAEINSGNLTTIKFTMNRENDSLQFILFTFNH